MPWLCPECASFNEDALARCVCGHEIDSKNRESYIFIPEADKHKESDRDTQGQPREMALAFRGSAREYFRIWIVNLCLTLLTAGIFSAWAKVRKKRYFYSHIILDGTPFQYLGLPIPILKGRIIAAAAFAVYYMSSHFFTSLMPYILVAGTILAPWVVIRSAAFNARYSSFRNMTFSFEGGYKDALKEIYAWGLIPGLVVVGMILSLRGKFAVAGILFAVFGLAFPWWIRRFKNFIISNTSYGGRNGEFSATGRQFLNIYWSAGFIAMGIGIVSAIAVFGIFSFLKESQFLFLTVAPFYFGYVLAYAYVQAHGTNLVWNNIRLGSLRFQSTLRFGGMTKLYLTNAVAIIASAGLLIPWAVIRTLKYRADRLQVVREGDIAGFEGRETGAVRAVGSEMGDFFDMDISL